MNNKKKRQKLSCTYYNNREVQVVMNGRTSGMHQQEATSGSYHGRPVVEGLQLSPDGAEVGKTA
jgi:hypothetical protein